MFISNIERSELLKLNALLESSKTQPIDKKLMNKFAFDIKSIFYKSAQRSFKKPVVISKKVKHPKPWFGLQCNKARKRYQTARKNHSLHKNDASRRIMLNASKRYKATIKKYHSKHLIGLQNKIRQLRTEQPKQYWKLINSIDKKKDNIPISEDEMFNFFKSLNSDVDTQEMNADLPNIQLNINFLNDDDDTLNESQEILNRAITVTEINYAIKTLKLNKSSGTDDIVNEYIISTKELFMPVYEKLFNLILDNGIVPTDWLKGNIIPIYKNKGRKEDPANYRPITLLTVAASVKPLRPY